MCWTEKTDGLGAGVKDTTCDKLGKLALDRGGLRFQMSKTYRVALDLNPSQFH